MAFDENHIHNILRNRLFDYSRRNKLLYFKPSLKHLNLTIALIPENIESQADISEGVILKNKEIASRIINVKDISLLKYISSPVGPFFLSALNRIRLQANKDIHEYGFNQLKLAIGFLEWFDLKNNVPEKISSPLILLPVHLVKKKGVPDDFIIRFIEPKAEINPVLAGKLKELYNIILPKSIDLSIVSIIGLYQSLKKQIEASSNVQLTLVDKLDVEKLIIDSKQFQQKYNRTQKNTSQIDGFVADDRREVWRFDITNAVLGNFNYRKMSLIGDYDALMEKPFGSHVSGQLFGDFTKMQINHTESLPLLEQFQVIQADSTQQNAIAIARKNESYIIQGPPGTGKSQTIANLIADFVARGKKVLFVCEKRAAIDVVYFRLKQKKLDEFCTLIHDSQSDKKEFIMNLKKTSESYSKYTFKAVEIEHKRNQIIYHIERELYSVRLFHAFMKQRLQKANVDVRELLNIVISTRQSIASISFDERQSPGYDQWQKYGSIIQQMARATKQSGYDFFAENPLSSLHESTYSLYDQSNHLKEDFSKAIDLLDSILENLSDVDLIENKKNRFSDLRDFIHGLSAVVPLAKVDRLDLLVDGSELNIQFEKAIRHIKDLEKELVNAISKNSFWIEKLTPIDTENALETIKKYEHSFFSFLNGKYRRAKKNISTSYDFSKHQIRPTYRQVIGRLHEEHQLQNTFEQQKIKYEQFFRLGELKELEKKIKEIYQSSHSSTAFLQQIKNDKHTIEKVKTLEGLFQALAPKIDNKLMLADDENISGLVKSLDRIITHLKDLPLFLPHLKELSSGEVSLKKIIKKEHYTPEQIEALLAKNSLDRYFRLNPEMANINGNILKNHIVKIRKLYDDFLNINAIYIRSKQRGRYNTLIRLAGLSVVGKSEAEKEDKKRLSEGYKILSKEFDKSMRYKSIRELVSSESGRIIRELKPVWLMSPLSVSDTLPLQADYFDVVIFDEASQITLEEGIPSLYRAPQTIIVGDEMQMPPSKFFNHISEEEPEDLSTESFLEQGAHKFPSVMLGWHYRSRHESLIAFSNAAFYGNRLLTIPDCSHPQQEVKPISVETKDDAIVNLPAALARPISYHYVQHGVYNERTNIREAEYIAEMVRELLRQENNMSIGVVAFSKEQQREIEDAVARLTSVDRAFDQNLEEEYKRMEDGQFTGIFFKNLENIQGDERDIIIMSTCYGYDINGKMLMNFGPINREGGEKRLNVIFSRAKKHMCVVSSIKHNDITNHHNTGSNYLRKFLQYAEAVSLGNMYNAQTVLQSILSEDAIHRAKASNHVVLTELKAALEDNGYVVIPYIGQSDFKCQLGIKKTIDDELFIAGILLDDELHYINDDLLEQYIFKPQLLRNNGWNIIQVFSKDWYADKDITLDTILRAIERNPQEIGKPMEMAETELVSSFAKKTFVRFEIGESDNLRFWEIRNEDENLLIQYGKINGSPKRVIKTSINQKKAKHEMERLIRGKLKKGYIQVG
jgi:superfamily I DNA and/or RNA helicase/predicted DNA-binding WGR domain protein